MTPVLFRCPVTGLNVQGMVPHDIHAEPVGHVFVSVRCVACSQTHLVNPATREVMGKGEK